MRKTFRPKTRDICWQRQLRESYDDEGIPEGIYLDVKGAVVRSVSRAIAERIILKYEWLGTLPHGCTHFYGIFFRIYCGGVACISVGGGGANVYAYKEFRLANQKEMAYLSRGACVHWAPPMTNSKLISMTCKLIARDSDAKIMIAYADTDAGEIGTVYQASNWVYIGKGSSTFQWIAPSGRVLDQKLPSNLAKHRGGTRAKWVKTLRLAGWTEQETNPKHRYVYILDKRDKSLISLVESMRKEYPKRSVVVSAGEAKEIARHVTNVETEGASPILPLFVVDNLDIEGV